MPPASLSTLAVMIPGPTTASKINRRARRGLSRCHRFIVSLGAAALVVQARHALLPLGRNHFVECVVDGHDPLQLLLVVDDRNRQQVVLRDGLPPLVLARG